jgi:hypothetical protein
MYSLKAGRKRNLNNEVNLHDLRITTLLPTDLQAEEAVEVEVRQAVLLDHQDDNKNNRK